MSNQELAVLPSQQIVNVADSALSIDQVVKQRALITECMAKAMKEDQHYGKVPGCGDKPTLLQPGAQLLSHLFRLRPEYEIIETDLAGGHKRFRVTCRLFFIGSLPEIKIAEGVGESSSMESKHRFRNAAKEIRWTEDVVPPAYWNLHRADKQHGTHSAAEWLKNSYEGNSNMGTRKNEKGDWVFVEYIGGSEDKIENPNPADVFNTVLKIAKKRAFVDATITATASSDFFTQDLEDIRANIDAVETRSAEAQPANGTTPSAAPEKPGGKKQRQTKGKPPARPANGNDGDEIPMFNGENHKCLAGLLSFNEIEQERFMEIAREKKWIPETAKHFGAMTDETAKGFVEDFQSVLDAAGVK